MKRVFYNPTTGEEFTEDIEESETLIIPESTQSPTYEERLAALEKAMLEQLLGGG